jgi:menaquinone-dependent protoporphyrinogen IX oxidase
MGKILVAYTTYAGSTGKVAETIGKELSQSGLQGDVRRLEEVTGLDGYSGVVVGAPMILGWHRVAVKFVKQNHPALSRLPVAYFMTAMSFTYAPGESTGVVPVCIDPDLANDLRAAGDPTPDRGFSKLALHQGMGRQPGPPVCISLSHLVASAHPSGCVG